MGRSERRTYFERLCSLRDGYAASAVDRRGVLSIDDAMLYAEAVMTAVDEPAWDESGIGATGGVETEARETPEANAASGGRDWPFGPRPVGRWASDADGWAPDPPTPPH